MRMPLVKVVAEVAVATEPALFNQVPVCSKFWGGVRESEKAEVEKKITLINQ